MINVRRPILTQNALLVRVINPSLKDCGDRIGFVGKVLVSNQEGNVAELAFSWDNSGQLMSSPDKLILDHWDLAASDLRVRNVSYDELNQLRG